MPATSDDSGSRTSMKRAKPVQPLSTFSFPTKTLFGPGAISSLPSMLADLKIRRPLIVTDAGVLPTEAFARLKEVSKGKWPVFSEVYPNPIAEDVESGAQAFRAGKCDAVIAFGGGSPLDAGKAVRLLLKRPKLPLSKYDYKLDWSGLAPFIAIPTTAGTGSEVGRSSVITMGGRKHVLFHPALLAAFVILDPELTTALPARLTAATGADALTHCIESYTSTVFHPLCDGIALEGLHLISKALPGAVKNGNDLEARGHMQIAAMMGGIAFQKDLGVVHSLSHPLSTLCGLHHGTANALTLPVSMKFNAARKPGLYRRVGIALGLNDPSDKATIAFIRSLLEEIGIRSGLRHYGVKPEQFAALTEQALADTCHQTNPVPVSKKDLRALYEAAY
jgi:4-hydroxybutyrate dehydrogenase